MKVLQAPREADSPYAWTRLWIALALMTMGGSGMYSMAVALPPLQAEFAIARGDASLPFTFTMIGFGLGGVSARTPRPRAARERFQARQPDWRQ